MSKCNQHKKLTIHTTVTEHYTHKFMKTPSPNNMNLILIAKNHYIQTKIDNVTVYRKGTTSQNDWIRLCYMHHQIQDC